MTSSTDAGKDATTGFYSNNINIHKNFAKDAIGFSLGYYDGDYAPIGGNSFEAYYSGTDFGNGSANLYNGNIRHMVTAIEGMDIQGYAYTYDQLQRLTRMQVYRGNNLKTNHSWSGSYAVDDYLTQISYDKNGNILTLDRNGYGAELEMDRFTYQYYNQANNGSGFSPDYLSNRLSHVDDSGQNYTNSSADPVYGDIKSGMISGNYEYNKLGELTKDASESMELEWRYGDHKLHHIRRTDQDSPDIEFVYNPLGVRVAKITKPRSGGTLLPQADWRVTYYTYDANGQLMASYNSELYNGTERTTTLEEQYIYGSNRIGTLKANKGVYFNGTLQPAMIDIQSNKIGKKRYELTNHLGNVLATITDRKVYNSTDGYYEPVITMKADYYAFGMLQPGRNEGISDARYGYQGSEKTDEIKGSGNHYTTFFRELDPRLGRWWATDPVVHPSQSPYCSMDNNPILYNDPLGDDVEYGSKKDERRVKRKAFFNKDFRAQHEARVNDSELHVYMEAKNKPNLNNAQSEFKWTNDFGQVENWVEYSKTGLRAFGGSGLNGTGGEFNFSLPIPQLNVEWESQNINWQISQRRQEVVTKDRKNTTTNSPSRVRLNRRVDGSPIILDPKDYPDRFTLRQDRSTLFDITISERHRLNGRDHLGAITVTGPFTVPTSATIMGSLTVVIRSNTPLWPYADSSGNPTGGSHRETNSSSSVTYTRWRGYNIGINANIYYPVKISISWK